MSQNFSIRLSDPAIARLDKIAEECKVKRANVIDWACEAYCDFFEANGGRQLTTSDMREILKIISDRAQGIKQFPLQMRLAAETQGVSTDPTTGAEIGGATTAHKKIYPKATRRKSA